MKNSLLIFATTCCFVCANFLSAQQVPTPTPSQAASNSSLLFWSRTGNNNSLNTNNIFGTQWNSPIYTITNGITRTRLNGTLPTPINSVNQNVDGYFGIGRNNFFATNSPWSMLHLEGGNNTVFGGSGWRAWMNTGARKFLTLVCKTIITQNPFLKNSAISILK